MKKTLIGIFAAITLIASGYMIPSVYAHDMNKAQSGADEGQMGMMSQGEMKSWNGSYDVGRLIGRDVRGTEGQIMGTVKDFVIDPNGHVFALVASSDESGRTVAVPFEAFSAFGSEDHLFLNLTEDQLAKAPEFDQGLLADRSWSDDVYRSYGLHPIWSNQPMTGQYGTFQQGFQGSDEIDE